MKHIFPYLLLVLVLSACHKKTPPTQDQLVAEQFAKMYHTKNIKGLKSLTSEQFTLGVYGRNDFEFLVSGILKTPSFQLDSARVTSINSTPDSSEIKANLTYYFNNKPPIHSNITLNSKHQISSVALWDEFYQVNRTSPSTLIDSIPIEFDGHSIKLKITMNNSPEVLNMLFDTGSDGTGVDLAAVKRTGMTIDVDQHTNLVGGKVNVKFSLRNNIHVGSQIIRNKKSGVFKDMKEGFDGLIGGPILSKFKTKVDLDKKMIYLYSFGKYVKQENEIPFVLNDSHLPVVKVTQTFEDGKELAGDYIFDTGAHYSIISFSAFVKENHLLSRIHTNYRSNMVSVNLNSLSANTTLPKLSVGGHEFKQVNAAFQEPQDDEGIWTTSSGSLGIDIIRRFNFTIDYLNRVIILEPNQSYNDPFSKFLGGAEFSYNAQHQYEVTMVVRGSIAYKKGVREGAILKSDGEVVHVIQNKKIISYTPHVVI